MGSIRQMTAVEGDLAEKLFRTDTECCLESKTFRLTLEKEGNRRADFIRQATQNE